MAHDQQDSLRKPAAPSGASTPPSALDTTGPTPEQPKATPPVADFSATDAPSEPVARVKVREEVR